MNVYQVKKLDEMGGLSYRPGNAAPIEPEQPLYFASLAGAEAHLAKVLSCDISRSLSTNSLQKTYKSHLGQFVCTEIAVIEDAPKEVPSDLAGPGKKE